MALHIYVLSTVEELEEEEEVAEAFKFDEKEFNFKEFVLR